MIGMQQPNLKSTHYCCALYLGHSGGAETGPE